MSLANCGRGVNHSDAFRICWFSADGRRLCACIPLGSEKAVTPSQPLIIRDLGRNICRHKPSYNAVTMPKMAQREDGARGERLGVSHLLVLPWGGAGGG